MKLFSNEIIRRQISCTHKEFARFNLALHKGTRSVVGPGLLSENQHVSPSVRPPSLSIWSDGNARRAGLFPSTLLYFFFLLFNLNSDSLRWVAPQLFRSPCGGYKLKTGGGGGPCISVMWVPFWGHRGYLKQKEKYVL